MLLPKNDALTGEKLDHSLKTIPNCKGDWLRHLTLPGKERTEVGKQLASVCHAGTLSPPVRPPWHLHFSLTLTSDFLTRV